jgi:hypothetical protein
LFLTHPRNTGRKDLGCPFGCREAHRKKTSTQRSVAYYQHREGKFKKKLLNARRTRNDSSSEVLKRGDQSSSSGGTAIVLPDAVLVKHLQTVVALIERRKVRLEDMWGVVKKFLRQRRMDNRKSVVYGERHREKPP